MLLNTVDKMPHNKLGSLTCPACQLSSENTTKYQFKDYNLLICNSCTNGFTYPVPKDMSKYYPDNYWQSAGLLGQLKNSLYGFFQLRRADWIKEYLKRGAVLDVGAGEALFAKKMPGYEILSIDFPGSKVKNPSVLKVDFLKWKTTKKFDAIVFWESLEHVPNPANYLKKTFQLLKKNGIVFIECPQFNSWEAKIFGRSWHHLDPPRHLSDFSGPGLTRMLKKTRFKILKLQSISAPEYAYSGFVISVLKKIGLDPIQSYTKKENMSLILLSVAALLPFAVIIESLLYLFGQSPIMLAVARKL